MKVTNTVLIVVSLLGAILESNAFGQTTRTWNGVNSNWHNPANWSPVGVPESNDDVIHGTAGVPVDLSQGSTAVIDTLLLTDGAKLSTSGNRLWVSDFDTSGWMKIEGIGSELVVQSTDPLNIDVATDTIELESGGSLAMEGGQVHINRQLVIDATSRLSGHGKIEIFESSPSAPPIVMSAHGMILAEGGPLSIVSSDNARADFGPVHLNAEFGDLLLDVDLEESDFEGLMTVGEGHSLQFERPIRMSSDAILNLTGSAGSPAMFRGPETYHGGITQVEGTGIMDGLTVFLGPAIVELAESTDELRLTNSAAVIGNYINESQPTPSFRGQGKVVNQAATGLLLANGPVVETTFVNQAELNLGILFINIGFEVGFAEFNDFIQTSDGKLKYDIGLVNDLPQGDEYIVHGTAELDGRLEVRLVDIYDAGLPDLQVGDSFEIINAANGVSGRFNEVTFSHAPEDTFWQIEYQSNAVRITLVDFLLGDVNGDGVLNLVDVGFFIELLANGEFLAAGDINQDGVLDLLDVQPFIELLVD